MFDNYITKTQQKVINNLYNLAKHNWTAMLQFILVFNGSHFFSLR